MGLRVLGQPPDGSSGRGAARAWSSLCVWRMRVWTRCVGEGGEREREGGRASRGAGTAGGMRRVHAGSEEAVWPWLCPT